MENYNDIVSSIVMGAIMIAIIIPLIGVLRHTNKEKRRLDEVKSAKKPETPQPAQTLLHEDW